jgi:hypothetical protein
MAKWWAQPSFWLNLIGGLIDFGQWELGKNFWPGAAVDITIALGALQIIANMIGGSTAMATLKNTVGDLTKKLDLALGHKSSG